MFVSLLQRTQVLTVLGFVFGVVWYNVSVCKGFPCPVFGLCYQVAPVNPCTDSSHGHLWRLLQDGRHFHGDAVPWRHFAEHCCRATDGDARCVLPVSLAELHHPHSVCVCVHCCSCFTRSEQAARAYPSWVYSLSLGEPALLDCIGCSEDL